MVSCQQLRTRDCKECTIYLHCTSQPVIEASSEMKFGCFQCHYPQLKGTCTQCTYKLNISMVVIH